MNAFTRLSVYAGLLILAGLGVCATGPDVLACIEDPFTGMREAQQRTRQAEEVSQELDRRGQAVLRRMALRQQIAWDVADGRLRLAQAAGRFRDLNGEAPECQESLRWAFPGKSDEERLCRQVIAWTHLMLAAESPGRAEVVSTSLNAELDAELKQSGTVALPE